MSTEKWQPKKGFQQGKKMLPLWKDVEELVMGEDCLCCNKRAIAVNFLPEESGKDYPQDISGYMG